MIRKNPSGDLPVIHESAFVDPTAIICGKMFIGENVVIRADEVMTAAIWNRSPSAPIPTSRRAW